MIHDQVIEEEINMAILMQSDLQTDLAHIWELSEPSSSSESENSSVVSPPHKRPRPLTARDLANDSFGKSSMNPFKKSINPSQNTNTVRPTNHQPLILSQQTNQAVCSQPNTRP